MINWKVRVKQKWFWLTLIPLLFLFIDQVLQLFALVQALVENGGALYDSPLMALVINIVGLAFTILAIIGVPVDLTTAGYGDSARALAYDVPAANASELCAAVYEESENDEGSRV